MPSLSVVVKHSSLQQPLEFWVPEGKAVVFGRNKLKCHFVVPVQSFSRQHFVIKFQGANVMVKDLESSQGTFLNGKAISGTTKLEISFGSSATLEVGSASVELHLHEGKRRTPSFADEGVTKIEEISNLEASSDADYILEVDLPDAEGPFGGKAAVKSVPKKEKDKKTKAKKRASSGEMPGLTRASLKKVAVPYTLLLGLAMTYVFFGLPGGDRSAKDFAIFLGLMSVVAWGGLAAVSLVVMPLGFAFLRDWSRPGFLALLASLVGFSQLLVANYFRADWGNEVLIIVIVVWSLAVFVFTLLKDAEVKNFSILKKLAWLLYCFLGIGLYSVVAVVIGIAMSIGHLMQFLK